MLLWEFAKRFSSIAPIAGIDIASSTNSFKSSTIAPIAGIDTLVRKTCLAFQSIAPRCGD